MYSLEILVSKRLMSNVDVAVAGTVALPKTSVRKSCTTKSQGLAQDLQESIRLNLE